MWGSVGVLNRGSLGLYFEEGPCGILGRMGSASVLLSSFVRVRA